MYTKDVGQMTILSGIYNEPGFYKSSDVDMIYTVFNSHFNININNSCYYELSEFVEILLESKKSDGLFYRKSTRNSSCFNKYMEDIIE